jgi:alpha-tubulin suppressor-like RCC1 family protein
VPKKVEYFEKHGIKIKKICAGMYHTIAIANDDRVYTWGRGLYGVLGNASNNYSLEPELNDEFEYIRKEDPTGKVITKLDSADEYSGALMRDGTIWVWGKNDRGQMGVGSGIGIDMVESENVPREVLFVDEKTNTIKKIKDFSAGMNTMLFQDEEGGIYKTGLKLNYTPGKITLMEEFSDPSSIAGMTCGRRHYVIWNKNN